MNMKMLAFVMMALMVVGVSNAIISPLPIAVKVISVPASGITAAITNLRTGETMSGLTNEYGEFVVDWANSQNKYNTGDKFRVNVNGLSKEFTFIEAPPEIQTFSFVSPCQISKILTFGEILRVFDDGCNVEVTAPTIPACPEQTIFPPQDYTLTAIVIALFAIFGVGTYVKITKPGSAQVSSKVVNGKILHSHKNVSGYHNPDMIHSIQPHKKGEMYPRYATVKNALGKYNYLG